MSSTDPSTPSLAGLTALIVEDHDDLRELLHIRLEPCQMTVYAAASVSDALALWRDEHVDIIISDIGLPDEDGYAFMQKVRSSPSQNAASIPAIALTAYTGVENRARALLAGFNALMTKPFDFAKLIECVKHLLLWSTASLQT